MAAPGESARSHWANKRSTFGLLRVPAAHAVARSRIPSAFAIQKRVVIGGVIATDCRRRSSPFQRIASDRAFRAVFRERTTSGPPSRQRRRRGNDFFSDGRPDFERAEAGLKTLVEVAQPAVARKGDAHDARQILRDSCTRAW